MKNLWVSIIVISLFAWVTTAFADDDYYYVIADAGSTGTKLHIFRHNNNKKMPLIQELFTENNNIPLASFNEKPELAYASLKPLLENAAQKINAHHVKMPVPIAVLGTAGMRLLPTSQQQAIYKNIHDNISEQYKNIYTPKSIQTISGKIEGVYGWLDVNYLLENFQNHKPTTGSIDVGGASTTIAFATDKSYKPIDEMAIKINDAIYTVFSKSFLGLGLNEARSSMNADPHAGHCYPKGYEESSFKGDFNLLSCSNIYNQVIANYHIQALELPIYKIPNFIAFSGAYYTFHFFDADPNIPDQETLEQTIILPTCKNHWDVLKDAYPAEPESYLANYCNHSIFLTNLFYNAFQLQYQQINIVSKIKDKKIDWTLGAILYTVIKNEA